MEKLSDGMDDFIANLKRGEKTASSAFRVAEVHIMWRNAVEAVYKDAAQMVLDHINAVYIMSADAVDDKRAASRVVDGGTVLVVYVDDSMIRSDLDARQEFLKIKLNEQGEHVESFCIKPSRFDMKARHPFRLDFDDLLYIQQNEKIKQAAELEPLSDKICESVDRCVSQVEHKGVRQALKKAITVDLQYKISQKDKNRI